MIEPTAETTAKGIDPTTKATTKASLLSESGLAQLNEKIGDSPTACIIFDIAGVGIANEYLGRNVVDDYMQKLVSHLKEVFPEGEVVRWGGDEFLVITPIGVNTAESELIERLKTLQDPHSETAKILNEVTTGIENALQIAEGMSALKSHQRALANEFLQGDHSHSIDDFRKYLEVEERQERFARANVLTLYNGSWEYLGQKPSANTIVAAVSASDGALNDAKLGRNTAQHFRGDQLDLSAEVLSTPIRGNSRIDLAISNEEKGQVVFRLSNIEDMPASQILESNSSYCTLVNISNFGAINNNFSPETADQMLASVADRIFQTYGQPQPMVFRSAGGELMIFSDTQLDNTQLARFGNSLLTTVKDVVNPKDQEGVQKANASVIGTAIQNEIRHFECSAENGKRWTTQGLGDIFISQVASMPQQEEESVGDYMSAMKKLCHSNPESSIYCPRDKSKHLLFDSYHNQVK